MIKSQNFANMKKFRKFNFIQFVFVWSDCFLFLLIQRVISFSIFSNLRLELTPNMLANFDKSFTAQFKTGPASQSGGTTTTKSPPPMIQFWGLKLSELVSNFWLSYLSANSFTNWLYDGFSTAFAHVCEQCDRRNFQTHLKSSISDFLEISKSFSTKKHQSITSNHQYHHETTFFNRKKNENNHHHQKNQKFNIFAFFVYREGKNHIINFNFNFIFSFKISQINHNISHNSNFTAIVL